jgi:transcriptional accessory protein Tex/SPT6
VAYFLDNKKLDHRCQEVNALAMEAHAEEVKKILESAKKDKKNMVLKLKPIDKSKNLADLTKFYLEGKGQRKRKEGTSMRNPGIWEAFKEYEENGEDGASEDLGAM